MAPREKKEGRSVDRSAPQGHRPQGGEGTPRRGHRPLLFYTHNNNTRPAWQDPRQISSLPSTTAALASVQARNPSGFTAITFCFFSEAFGAAAAVRSALAELPL